MNDLGQRIIDYRVRHDIKTQREFAKLVGLGEITVSNIERGLPCSRFTEAKIKLFLDSEVMESE